MGVVGEAAGVGYLHDAVLRIEEQLEKTESIDRSPQEQLKDGAVLVLTGESHIKSLGFRYAQRAAWLILCASDCLRSRYCISSFRPRGLGGSAQINPQRRGRVCPKLTLQGIADVSTPSPRSTSPAEPDGSCTKASPLTYLHNRYEQWMSMVCSARMPSATASRSA